MTYHPVFAESTYIQFEFVKFSDTGKTFVWQVISKQNASKLGEIRWFGRWRKYAFYASAQCVFEETCLRSIATFIEERTKAQRSKA